MVMARFDGHERGRIRVETLPLKKPDHKYTDDRHRGVTDTRGNPVLVPIE